jgi:hypothetical protein
MEPFVSAQQMMSCVLVYGRKCENDVCIVFIVCDVSLIFV